MSCLYYYKLISEYPCDVSKQCKLTVNEIDSNFYQLKGDDIKSAEFIREDKTLVLTRNNEEKLIVPLNDITYNLDVSTDFGTSGTTLTISYDGTDGKKSVTIPNILTYDNLLDAIGSDILTKVITDGTLKGLGTISSPLGIAGVEKTGMLAPAVELFDLTSGGTLPEVAKLGTRYVTKEYINDYGYLYNIAGVEKIQQKLNDAYISKNTKEDKIYAWRVPTKADWDALLNSLEPCEYKNHNSARCHVELGKLAGKYLKSECAWLGQPECDCTMTMPITGCTYEDDSYVDESANDSDIPTNKEISPVGVDKYGMTILPSGVATLDTYGRPQASSFKERAVFWTTTHVYNDCEQDIYAKIFDWNKGGVMQVAECPEPYYSVRLVKDYDGSNYYENELIDGILYKTVLFPESGQIWLASNYCDKAGFIEYREGGEIPEVVNVNNGQVLEKRAEMFINEWNGRYWEKKIMHEGDTIVIENPYFDQGSGTTTTVSWIDKEGVTHYIEVEIPKAAQSNIEYRVYTEDEGCNKVLANTDDLVVERVINIVVPMLEQEREERIAADEILSGAIETEREERMNADEELSESISAETEARIAADEVLSAAVETEREERISADTELWDALADETEARIEADEILSGEIETEREERISADTELWEALSAETEARISADTILDEKIDAETERAISAETELREALDEEIERAIAREDEIEEELLEEIDRAKAREDEIDGQLIDPSNNPYVLNACLDGENPNMVLKSKDNNEEHFIKIIFDGNFGQI